MSTTVSITGLSEATEMIQSVPKKFTERLMVILKETALVCMDHAKRSSPVVTGRYRSSIHVETEKSESFEYNDDSGKEFTGKFSQNPEEGEIFVGTNVEYAGKVEAKHRTMDEARIQAQFYLTTHINELTR